MSLAAVKPPPDSLCHRNAGPHIIRVKVIPRINWPNGSEWKGSIVAPFKYRCQVHIAIPPGKPPSGAHRI